MLLNLRLDFYGMRCLIILVILAIIGVMIVSLYMLLVVITHKMLLMIVIYLSFCRTLSCPCPSSLFHVFISSIILLFLNFKDFLVDLF